MAVKLKRIICTLIILAIMASTIVFAATSEGFEIVAENERLQLLFNKTTAEIAITDKLANKYTWYSNNPTREYDSVATGMFKMNLSAQLFISIFNSDTRIESIKNSFTASLRKNGVSSMKIENGIKLTYFFKDEKISLPLEITLGNDGFNARVALTEVKEEGVFRLSSVTILPYLGSGCKDDSGYMIVPDGSGALINFNNGKTKVDDYNRPVYGTDPVYTPDMVSVETEMARLPIYGIKNGDNAFLAVIEKGGEISNIIATVSGKKTSYNAVYPEMSVRYAETLNMGSRTVKVFEKNGAKPPLLDEIKINYFLLNGNDANYSGMARRYRQYLLEDKKAVVSKSEKNDVLIDVLGSIQKKTSFLGVPYLGTIPVTTYKQAQQMLGELKASGVDDMSILYTGYSKDDVGRKIQQSFSTIGKLGGNVEFNKLINFLGENNILFFPTVNSTNIYKDAIGVSKTYDSIKNIVGTAPTQFIYKLSTYYKDAGRLAWKLLRADNVVTISKKLIDSFNKKKVKNIAYTNLVNNTYADYTGGGTSRYATGEKFSEVLGYAKGKLENVMGIEANGFSLPYLTHIAKAPIWNSGFDIEDEAVPFYQIAISGIKQYYVPPINLEYNKRNAFLRAVETGSKLSYMLTYSPSTEFITTEFDGLYSVQYKEWADNVVQNYKEIKPVFEATKGSKIYSNERLQQGVYKTTYENGYFVIVNYNNQDAIADGQIVKAQRFVTGNGGRQE